MACCVGGCGNRNIRDKDVKFYRIPKERKFKYAVELNTLSQERRAKWLAILNPKNQIWSEAKLNYAAVCSKHFVEGRPARLEDVEDVDWVPTLHLDDKRKKKRKSETAETPKKVIRSSNFCTLCYLSISRREALEVCDKDGNFTQFGCVLHHILKMSGCPFRSRFCCKKCSKTVLDCFSLITDINIQALVTNMRTGKNSITDILDEGCVKCGQVFASVLEYSDHLASHVYEAYNGRTATLDRQADMKDLKERKVMKDKARMTMIPATEESDTESAHSTDDEEVEHKSKDHQVVLQDDGDASSLLENEHNYDKEKERKKENVEPPKKAAGKDLKGTKRKRGRPRKILAESANKSKQSLKQSRFSVSTAEFIKRRKRQNTEETADNKAHLRGSESSEDEDVLPREKLDFPCTLCYFEFSHEAFLKEHMKEHKTVPCGSCSSKFKDRESLAQHEAEKHGKEPAPPKKIKEESLKKVVDDDFSEYQCQMCSFGFSNPRILQNHVKAFHPNHKAARDGFLIKPGLVETENLVITAAKQSGSNKNSDGGSNYSEMVTEYLEDESLRVDDMDSEVSGPFEPYVKIEPDDDDDDDDDYKDEELYECSFCNFKMPNAEIYAYHLKSAHKGTPVTSNWSFPSLQDYS